MERSGFSFSRESLRSNARQRTRTAAGPILATLLLLANLPASAVFAQAMTVVGGSQKAANCYREAQMRDHNLVTHFSLEDCHYALEYVSLNRRDRMATLTNRGILYLALEQPAEALEDFEAAVAIDPDKGEIYVNRGNAWFMSGDLNKAIENYLTAAELGIEQQHLIHLNLGIAYERQRSYRMAETAYEEALALSPQWPLAINNLAALREKMAAEANR